MNEVKISRNHPNAKIPKYHTEGSAAFDFCLIEPIQLAPGEIQKVRTGLIIKTPTDHALIIASRSSNPIKKGIDLPNSIGVVDSDYAGPEDEIFILLRNITNEPISLEEGDRIAQGMFVPVTRGIFTEIENSSEENRGGHGSTGV